MFKKSKIAILSILILTIASSLIYISYGYVTAKIEGNEGSNTFVNIGQILKVEFSGGTPTLTSNQGEYFIPGSTLTKTFTITNTGNVSLKYSINLDEITNDFTRKEDLTYELISNDVILKNGMYDAKGIFPSEKTTILSKDVLNVGETKTYTLNIYYLNSEENQIVDSGKIISTKITFEESKTNINSLIVYGNSIQNGTPTAETPVEIESVGEKTVNLLNIADNSFTVMVDGKYKEINKQLASEFYLPANKTLYFKLFFEDGTILDSNYELKLRQNSYVHDGDIVIDATNKGVTLTEEQSQAIRYVYIYINTKGGTEYAGKKPIGIIATEDENPTKYEPYGYKIPVKARGKNLVNLKEKPKEYNYGYTFENEKYVVNNSAEWTPNRWILNLKPNTKYTLSVKGLTNNTYVQISGYLPGTTAPIEGAISIFNGSNLFMQFNTGNNGSVSLSIYSNQLVEQLVVDKLLIEEGNAVTNYEPYYEPITTNIYLNEPLRKIGAYKDYIDFANGIIHRNIHSKVLDGTEDWKNRTNYYNETSNTFYLERNILTPKTKYGFDLIISNYFKNTGETIWTNTFTSDGICGYSGDIYYDSFIRINNQLIGSTENVSADNIALFKTWLSSNKPTVYYVLNEEIPDDVILPKIETSKNLNIIEACSSNGVCGEVEVEFDE